MSGYLFEVDGQGTDDPTPPVTKALEVALNHQAIIDTAVGILMERGRIGRQTALAHLAAAASSADVEVYDLAQEMVKNSGDANNELPDA